MPKAGRKSGVYITIITYLIYFSIGLIILDNYNYSLNKERLKRYIINKNDKKEAILELYLWNIKLSKEIYPVISLLEVALRNHINNALKLHFGDKWLLNQDIVKSLLKDKELTTYLNSFQSLSDKNKINEGKLVAELNLGFWVNLFNKKYKVNIWHKKGLFEAVFPCFDIKTSNRIGVIYPKLKEFQHIRNRISHHEAIFDHSNGLDNSYNEIVTLLKWISPDVFDLSLNVNEFHEVWKEKSSVLEISD